MQRYSALFGSYPAPVLRLTQPVMTWQECNVCANCDPDNFFLYGYSHADDVWIYELYSSRSQAGFRLSQTPDLHSGIHHHAAKETKFHFKNLISHHSSVYRLKLTKFGFCKVWWPLLERKFLLEILRSHYFHSILFPRKLLKETALYVSSNCLCIYHAKRYRALRGKRWRFRILWDTFTSVNFT